MVQVPAAGLVAGVDFLPELGRAEGSHRSPLPFESPVLVLRQFQPDAAAAHIDRALHGLPPFEAEPISAALSYLGQPLLTNEIELDRNRRLQILFEKLGVPSAPGLKRHVHAAGRSLVSGTGSAELLAKLVRRC